MPSHDPADSFSSKLSRWLLCGAIALSLAANLYLGAAIYQARIEVSAVHRIAPVPSAYPVRLQQRRARVEKSLRPIPDRPRQPNASVGISATDLPGLISQLQAAGYPARVIRPTVMRLLDENFDRRVQELLGSAEAFHAWKKDGNGCLSEAEREGVKTLAREFVAESRALLGDLPVLDDAVSRLRWERQLGAACSWEKFVEVGRINMDYDDLHRTVELAPGASRDLRSQHDLIERERRLDLEALLSPAELDEFDLRYSSTSGMIKAKLRGREVTEEEFRRLFREQRALDQRIGGRNER